MMKKIRSLAWPLFAPMAYILWTIDYYLVFFGLSFYLYKLSTENGVVKIVLLLLALPILTLVVKSVYDTTFFTAMLAAKHKNIFFLFAAIYSYFRVRSIIQYCSVKPLTIPDSTVIQLPCYTNTIITLGQLFLIVGLGIIFVKASNRPGSA